MQIVSKDKHKIDIMSYQISKPFKRQPGGRLNKKNGLTRYGNSHVKDKTS